MHQSSVHVLAFLAVEAVRRDVNDPRKRHRRPDPIARPGLVRRLLDRLGGPVSLREPGFAASAGWLDGVVPALSGYPQSR